MNSPTIPRPYRLEDGSYVLVLQADIERAAKLGLNPEVDLEAEVTGSGWHFYDIVGMRAAKTRSSKPHLRPAPVQGRLAKRRKRLTIE